MRLPDLELSFEVHTDALDRALGGVLVQEGHLAAFESQKLDLAEQRYNTHKKEMTHPLPRDVEALLYGDSVHGND